MLALLANVRAGGTRHLRHTCTWRNSGTCKVHNNASIPCTSRAVVHWAHTSASIAAGTSALKRCSQAVASSARKRATAGTRNNRNSTNVISGAVVCDASQTASEFTALHTTSNDVFDAMMIYKAHVTNLTHGTF